ncbi:hypothetical protein [Streptomyces decoyicus]|uniref:hypothetical protein n=1 Tax=Streptomyces decoyicus TaxID=249567 RepID=UPI0033BD1A72
MSVPAATQLSSLVPDSSFLHPYDLDFDGLRRLAACGPEHLRELEQQYHERPFVKEELWAGKVARALRNQPDLDEEELADVTGLNFIQIERSLTWESECFFRGPTSSNDHEKGSRGPDSGQGRERPS